ncbi:hypothetical protein [Nocardiopsis coralliicola]
MTEPFNDETEERLRAILRAEADAVDPSPEALTRIRERAEGRSAAGWFAVPWLRPALAVGAAAAIAGTVLLGTPQFRDQVFPTANESAAGGGQQDYAAPEQSRDPADGDTSGSGGSGGTDPGGQPTGGTGTEGGEGGGEATAMDCAPPGDEPGTDPDAPTPMATGGPERSASADPEPCPTDGPGTGSTSEPGGEPGEPLPGTEEPAPGDGDGEAPSPDPGGGDGSSPEPIEPPVE